MKPLYGTAPLGSCVYTHEASKIADAVALCIIRSQHSIFDTACRMSVAAMNLATSIVELLTSEALFDSMLHMVSL